MDWGFIAIMGVWFLSVGFLAGMAFMGMMDKLDERAKEKQRAIREVELIVNRKASR